MNPQHQIQLEDVQKKLSVFKKHLDLLARCTGESKNVEKYEVLSAVAELQCLVEWASQQSELESVSAVLLVKLQELNQIRENLEKTSPADDDYSVPEVNDGESTVLEKYESNSKDSECVSDIVVSNFYDNNGENNVEEDSVSVDKDSLYDYSASTEDPNLANAESPESIEDTNADIIPNDDKTDEATNVDENSNSQQINEKEAPVNSEISLEYSEDQQTSKEIKTEDSELQSSVPEVRSPNLFRSEVVIIETDEDNKPIEDSNESNDPLDVCMYAIRNLYESLRVKENELLKLSAMQNDQKHIEALQAVIIDFHKDKTNLISELEKSKKENLLLKEQVLELEEAENDARLEAQKLEQKLVFLQEKDSHSQAELSQLKQNLKNSAEALVKKEEQEKELRAQIKYMETLVQKYEDQIKRMESKEVATSQNVVEIKPKPEIKEEIGKPEKRLPCNKGTQTYPPSQTKINCNGEGSNDGNINIDNNNVRNTDLNLSQKDNIPDESKKIICEKKLKDTCASISSIPSTSANETTQLAEQAEFVNIQNVENISQKELLLRRLHKLIDEDANLQQQIHYVDEINLAMWKKLQNLDSHIGECKRQNINETNPVITKTELNDPNYRNSDTGTQEPSNIGSNKNIPQESSNCLDQNEQYIQERLTKLEEINASFEKDLKTREDLCKEKDKKYEEWMETEKRIKEDLNRLTEEKDWITNQVNNLKKETETRKKHIIEVEEDLVVMKDKYQQEISEVRANQEEMTEPLNSKVNQMLTKEKEILKMITNLKSEKNRSQGKIELERLKCCYIELQLELSQARDEIRKIEEQFKTLLDQCESKHLLEEAHRTSELERLRNENARCDKMINNLQKNEKDLINALEKQEKYLQEAREDYKKNLEETEEEHRSVETDLESQLRQIEEGTAIATSVLMEERVKVEKELQHNIEDLKSKEEIYKARIAELERDVGNLHEELHKMAEDSESKNEVEQLHETGADETAENIIEVPCSKTENLKVAIQTSLQSEMMESHLNSSEGKILEKTSLTVKPEIFNDNESKDCVIVEEVVEENVDELRAQVRELQNHIEKISVEVPEMPPVQPSKPITTSSLKMQKVEDIDYAEVDECCLKAWRKPVENTPISKDNTTNFQGFNSGNHSTGYKENLKNQKVPAEEAAEENDYDEVLPRPTNFHVVQQVGSDTLLVGWNYVNPSVLDGFEVYLDDHVHERIYIPDRTKALISGLNLRKPIRLSICALSRYGQISEPAVLELSSSQEINANYFDDEDEYRDFEDPMKRNQRPYSMEW